MYKRSVQKHLVHVFLVSMVILLVGGGVALLEQWQQGPISSHASDDNVVGPPSLPAATVDTIFRHLGSPMVGTGQAVETAARAQNIDDAFALAVWSTETNDGAAGVGLHDNNPGSVRGSVGYPSAFDGYTIYPSYSAAVTYWFGMLKKVYINRGLTTVFAISHPYVGTSTSDLWAGKVITLMNRYRAEAPPPPTSNATPTTLGTTTIARHAQAFLQQEQTAVQAAPQNLDANTQQDSTSGLNNTTKMLLVLFDLLAALGLGLMAHNMLKRYANSVQIAHLLSDNRQAQVLTGFQQSAAFLPVLTSAATERTTEGLQWPTPITSTLGARQPARSASLWSDFIAPQTPAATEKWPVVNTPAMPALSFSQSMQQQNLSASNRAMPASPLHRTRLLPSQPATSVWPPSAPVSQPEQQPQLVEVGATGTGRSNGLLSRYREAQSQQGF